MVGYSIDCGVCGTPIDLTEWEARAVTFKLCPECITAIKWAKNEMKKNAASESSKVEDVTEEEKTEDGEPQ